MRTDRARWTVGVGSTIGLLGLIACNVTEPDDRHRDPVDLRPQLFTAGGASGSSQIGIPATNSAEDNFGSVAPFEIVNASRFDLVQIVVEGTVSSADAGYCDPPIGPIGTWGPFGVNGGSLRVQVTTDPYIGGLPTSGHGTNTMTVTFGVNQDISVRAERIGVVAGCSAGPGLNLSGTQSIDYEVYPYYQVTAAPAVVSAGDTVTYAASSHWTTTSEAWRYRFDDTTATPGAGVSSWAWVCQSASPCEFAPSRSGRIYRYGVFPDGSGHEMPGPITWVGNAPPLDIVLSASSSSVTRGDSVEFSVRNVGAGGELNAADLSWKFLPDSVQHYPNSFAPYFAPDSVVWTPTGTDSVWAGTMVHPGRVIVTGTQGGTTVADTIVVSVANRSFSSPAAILDTTAYNTKSLPVPFGDTLKAGELHLVPATASASAFFTAPSPLSDSVLSGPNTGYHWNTQSSLHMNRAYSLNIWINPPGKVKYTNNQGWLSTTEYLVSVGDSVGMVDFRAYTILHERGPAASSHFQRIDFGGSSDPGCGDVNAANERIVASSAFDLLSMNTQNWNRASAAITYASSHQFVYGHQQPPTAVADWVTIPGVRTSLVDPQSADKPLPDPTHCDVSSF